jgi:transmembrane sensor
MSGASETQRSQVRALTTKALAAEWLERRDRINWSEDDQREFDNWLEQSTANFLAYHRIAAAWGRAERLVALEPREFQPASTDTQSFVRSAPRRAAILVATILLFVSAGIALLLLPNEYTFSTPIGGRQTVTLADGSSVELNTDTVLHVRLGIVQRSGWLERGEAYFDIAHDARRPFVVTAGRHKITVLGTKFLIREEAGRLEVAMLDGRVSFASGENTSVQSALLTPGDVLVATADGIAVTKETHRQLAGELGWRTGILVFRNTPLIDAARQYNRYNREKIVIADTSAAELTISGALPATDTQEFIHIAKKFFGLRIKNYGDEIVISR